MQVTKGIILAGGTGSRLYPLNIASNKQLLPLYDKPVIYYPLSTLMLAAIREILIISSERDLPHIEDLLGTGNQFGLHISYQVQSSPRGIPEAFILAESFLNEEPSMLILGDNFFYGNQMLPLLQEAQQCRSGAHLFLHPVDNPSAYGILKFDRHGRIQSIIEKPKKFISHWAITGLYIFDGDVSHYAKQLTPSDRGELEITDLIKIYFEQARISFSKLGRGYVWYDTGTPTSLLQVGNFIETVESRQGLLISSPEEIALNLGYISPTDFESLVQKMPVCLYKKYLERLLESKNGSY